MLNFDNSVIWSPTGRKRRVIGVEKYSGPQKQVFYEYFGACGNRFELLTRCKLLLVRRFQKSKSIGDDTIFILAIVDPGLVSDPLNIELNVILKMSENH